MNDIALAWAVFFVSACGMTASPKFLDNRGLREISYLFSMILWVAAMYTWIVGFSDLGLQAIAWLHILPLIIVSGLLLIELGENMGKRGKYR